MHLHYRLQLGTQQVQVWPGIGSDPLHLENDMYCV